MMFMQALTPLTFGRGQMKATLLGALWGFGHCIGQLVLGLLLLVLKVSADHCMAGAVSVELSSWLVMHR